MSAAPPTGFPLETKETFATGAGESHTVSLVASRFQQALAALEAAHQEDPKRSPDGQMPWSVLYHRRMLTWLERLVPQPGEALRLAAASQHLRRWMIPRDRFPQDRPGYLRWRTELGRFHGQEAAKILRSCGYQPEVTERVAALLQKKSLRSDPETQALEDAACLVFLENEFVSFSEKHSDQKISEILVKTWAKMSPAGQALAQELLPSLPGSARQKILDALKT